MNLSQLLRDGAISEELRGELKSKGGQLPPPTLWFGEGAQSFNTSTTCIVNAWFTLLQDSCLGGKVVGWCARGELSE